MIDSFDIPSFESFLCWFIKILVLTNKFEDLIEERKKEKKRKKEKGLDTVDVEW